MIHCQAISVRHNSDSADLQEQNDPLSSHQCDLAGSMTENCYSDWLYVQWSVNAVWSAMHQQLAVVRLLQTLKCSIKRLNDMV